MINNVLELIDGVLLPRGYKRKRRIWYKCTQGVCQLLALQRSLHESGFFINLGLFVTNDGTTKKMPPRSDDWHFEGTYDHVVQLEMDTYSIPIVPEAETQKSILQPHLQNLVEVVVPFLESAASTLVPDTYEMDDFPHDLLWLKNVTHGELKILLKSLE